jgi:hypothetical protein
MLRFIAALVALPPLLTVLLAIAISANGGNSGLLNMEIFELGPLPVVLMALLWVLVIFLPMLLLAARVARLSAWAAALVGFLAALLAVLVSSWSLLIDSRLRSGFRAEHLGSSWPLLATGTAIGFLFWLLAIYRNPEVPSPLAARS